LIVAEIDAPEPRGGSEKFDSDALAALAGVPLINHAAFLFFIRIGVHKDEQFAIIDFVLEKQQAALGVDHNGFAGFLELAAVVGAALGLEALLEKNAAAATPQVRDDCIHVAIFDCA
jgi:hypothetical protein